MANSLTAGLMTGTTQACHTILKLAIGMSQQQIIRGASLSEVSKGMIDQGCYVAGVALALAMRSASSWLKSSTSA